MKVLVFGSSNIDYVYKVSHLVKPGETISALSAECFPGGKGLNQAIAVAKSEIDVYYAGCIGAEGLFLKEVMEKAGVNTQLVKITNETSGKAIIQVDEKGENSIILFAGANHSVTKEYVDEVLAYFDKGDIILLQNEINNIEYIVEKAYDKNMQIFLNPSPMHENLKCLDLNKIQYLILNEVEAWEFCNYTEAKHVLKYFREKYKDLRVVLTLGIKGSLYFDNENEFFCPAFLVDTVDTTSAGDTFTGYFISGIKNGYSIPKILKTATAASALAVSRKGASSSIPYIHEVKEALGHLKFISNSNFEIEMKKQRVLEYINRHLKDVKLEDVSKILGYSRTYSATWIKKYMENTFSAILKKCRCEKAAQLLLETDLSVKQIIELCGYENDSFFRKNFYAEFGKTPLEYRKFYEVK